MGDKKDAEPKKLLISDFEPAFCRIVCAPLAKFVPKWVHPNHITICSAFAIMAFCAISYLSVVVETKAAMLVCAGAVSVLIWAYATLDCMDGIHARATGQCSKVGEVLDHFVDSFGIPLNTAAVIVCAQYDHITFLIMIINTVLNFNSQLLLFYISGKFIAPPASGAFGQIFSGLIVFFVSLCRFFAEDGSYFYYALRTALLIASVIGLWVTTLNNFTFLTQIGWKKCGPFFLCLIPLLAIATVYIGQYNDVDFINGNPVATTFHPEHYRWCTPLAAVLVFTGISMRINGSYVIHCAARVPFNGFRPSVWIWSLVLLALHFFPQYILAIVGEKYVDYFDYVPFVAFGHMFVSSCLHFLRMMKKLK
eukprot:TRINITY_DN134_c0_g3_i1.p1 TRINITY_DN134_c0_g3~~TRINITY_DN134_c0_g3_i1.p1  ORF type:complete len:379 (-),score=81.57 TRINITY_DN134_c0_g3_i1:236-1330(-)